MNLPSLTFAIKRTSAHLKKNQLEFIVPKYCTKTDIANYLRAVYNIDPIHVSTQIPPRKKIEHPDQGKFHKPPSQTVYIWAPQRKSAIVTMKEDFKFDFPPLPPLAKNIEDKKLLEEKEDEAARKSVAQRFRGDNWKKLVISRYGELSEDLNKKDLVIDVNDIYNEISDPLQNLTLDDGVEVKGQAKRRLGIRYSKIKKKLLSTQPVKMKRLAAVKVKKMEIQQRIKSSIDNEKLRVESLKKLTSLK